MSDPHSVDTHVGSKVRVLRALQGLSQNQLANDLNLSQQQLQKYETGQNRISASKLYEIGQGLGVEPAYFFEGLDAIEGTEPPEIDMESARIAALISKISDRRVRSRIRDLVNVIISASSDPQDVAA